MSSLDDQLDAVYPYLSGLSQAELSKHVGQLPLGGVLYDRDVRITDRLLEAAGRLVAYRGGLAAEDLEVEPQKVRDADLTDSERVRALICEHKDRIDDVLSQDNVKATGLLILPMLGWSPPIIVPLPLLALIVLMLKIGLDEACEGDGDSEEYKAQPVV